jgi:hypothetical protein
VAGAEASLQEYALAVVRFDHDVLADQLSGLLAWSRRCWE